MRVLLDTNIFIHREDPKEVPENLQELLRLLSSPASQLIIHPASVTDIERDSDEERKKVILSKIKTYTSLKSPPEYVDDDRFIQVIGTPKNENDITDYYLLYAVYKNAVDFLLTEDQEVIKNSQKLGIGNRVFSIEDGLDYFSGQLSEKELYAPVAVTNTPVYNLDLNDPIFDKLKTKYVRFEDWWTNISREGRDAWIYRKPDGTLGSLLILKVERDEAIHSTPPLPQKDRIKICTLKVAETGYRIGEAYIKMAVDCAIKHNIDEIYLTHFTEENDHLVALIEDYGFKKVAIKDNGEDIYRKQILCPPDCEKTLIQHLYYPSFQEGEEVGKFIVPIQPHYHERLFPECPYPLMEYEQMKLSQYIEDFPSEGSTLNVQGNTIRKAYISNAPSRKIKKGDILLFYRSNDFSGITTLGVVESIFYGLTEKDSVLRNVGNRTVYTPQEVEEMVKSPTTVILFTFNFHFPKAVMLGTLREEGIIKTQTQSITEVSHRNYERIKRLGELDERFAIN